MTDTTAGIGTENGPFMLDAGPVMVSVGPEPHQEVNLTTAERMLSGLAVRSPRMFRDLLADAMIGDQ
jgi:hypothetical protein